MIVLFIMVIVIGIRTRNSNGNLNENFPGIVSIYTPQRGGAEPPPFASQSQRSGG